MKILGIDLSYHCGYAVLDGDTNRLLDKGIIQLDDLNVISIGDLPIDFQYLENAKAMATALSNLIATTNPDIIVIEETNQGKNRWSQKGLEFAHAILLERILLAGLASKVRYLDSSKWRSVLGIKLSKEQRIHNKKVSSNIRAKIRNVSGEGKITFKHLAVEFVNETYGLNFILKNNDIADAVCLASAIRLMKPAKNIDNQENVDKLISKAKKTK